MESLYAAVRNAQKKRALLLAVFGAAVIFLIGLAVMGSTWNLPIAIVTVLSMMLTTTAVRFLLLSPSACRRKLWSLVEDQPFAASFRVTAAAELAAAKPAFANREYRLCLYLTPTWLILVSTNCSLIRPRTALLGAERILLEHLSEHALCLHFADSDVTCRCEHVCEDLAEILHASVKEYI